MTLMITNQHSKLVRKYLSTFEVPAEYPGDKADLYQVGLIGVLKAMRTHDETKSNITTWAWYWIRSEIRSEVNRLSKKPSYYEEQVVQPKDKILMSQLLNMIRIPQDKEAMLRFLSGQKTNEISKHWQVSRQCIEQRIARAKDDIRKGVKNANFRKHGRRVHTGRRILWSNNASHRLDRPVSC